LVFSLKCSIRIQINESGSEELLALDLIPDFVNGKKNDLVRCTWQMFQVVLGGSVTSCLLLHHGKGRLSADIENGMKASFGKTAVLRLQFRDRI
jgi:hypothetical protein